MRNKAKIASIKKRISTLNHHEKVFDGLRLSYREQVYERGKPKKYLELTFELLETLGGTNIMEIGCMRAPLTHPITEMIPHCCNDGHSTYYWASSGAKVISVDICRVAVEIARKSCSDFKNCRVIEDDAIPFLKNYQGTIDLLYLDAWDITNNSAYAENHLSAYLAAKPKLTKTNIVAIDDTDMDRGGKGRCLTPVLMADGYQILVQGRQTIALKENSGQ